MIMVAEMVLGLHWSILVCPWSLSEARDHRPVNQTNNQSAFHLVIVTEIVFGLLSSVLGLWEELGDHRPINRTNNQTTDQPPP